LAASRLRSSRALAAQLKGAIVMLEPILTEEGVDLHHRQPSTGGCDGVAFMRVRLLPNPQRVQFCLKRGAIDHGSTQQRMRLLEPP
jgi:hypothetical protein